MDQSDNSTTISTTTKLMIPIHHMDPYLSTIHIGFASIGIPMNLLVAGTIILTGKLQAPQNIAWLGVGFSNIFVLTGFVVEVIAEARGENSFFMSLYHSTVGLTTASLILNLHLSLLERHLFVRRNSFYKKYVNNVGILAVQTICFVLISLILKGSLLYQSLSQSFKRILNEMDVALALSSGFIATITLYIPYKKFRETKFGHQLPVNSVVTNNSDGLVQSEDEKKNEEEASLTANSSQKSEDHTNSKKESICTILESGQEFSLLEMGGYYSIRINIKAFFTFIAAPFVLMSLSVLCLLIASVNPSLFDSCPIWFGTTFYIRGILVGFYTAVFNPVCFVGHSHDFSLLKQRCNPIGTIAKGTRRYLIKQRIKNQNRPKHGPVANL